MRVHITADYTYSKHNDVTLTYTEEDSRTEIQLSYDGYGEYGYMPETLVMGADSEMRLTDLLKEQLAELKAFLDYDFEDQELLSEEDWERYDDYPRGALYAFEYVITHILQGEN